MAMLVLPLPFLVHPTRAPLFSGDTGAVDAVFRTIEAPTLCGIARQREKHDIERPTRRPRLESAMTIFRVSDEL